MTIGEVTTPKAPLGPPPLPLSSPSAPEGPNGPAVQTASVEGAIFGTFFLEKTEFALPVSAIREVVNEPDQISSVPLCPPFVKGLFNLRGMIIPIIDLRIMLEFPERPAKAAGEEGGKVAIIENGDRCIGLLFDRAGEVLNESAAGRVDIRANASGVKDIVIDGVFKLDEGKRMVQILNPYELVNVERVPQSEANDFKANQHTSLGSRLSCVSFQLGHTNCAIDLRFVEEVRDMPPVESSLLAHGFIIGTTNIRGSIIPVVDFRSFMGNQDAFKLDSTALSHRKLLLLKTEAGQIGIMVYSIDSILPFFESDVLPFAKLALPRANIVRGCLVSPDDQLVMLLNHEKLLSDPSLVEPARTCQEVYANSTKVKADESNQLATSAQHERKTFILFSFSTCFAMDTDVVSEVINRPDDLLEPPYALKFVEGIVNLRGELITLINLRLLYGLPPGSAQEQKVLIFKHEAQKYAVLVDTVDEIVMTTTDRVSEDATQGFGNVVKLASDDVSGVLHVPRKDQENHMVMIMDPGALVRRCLGAMK